MALEAERAAKGVADYLKNGEKKEYLEVECERPITYTVPQKIHRDFSDKFVTMMFRVNAVVDNKQFLFTDSQGNLLGSQKTGYLGIGEMVKIIVLKKIIDACDGELHIRVGEV